MATAPRPAAAPTGAQLPNFLPEDFLALLRGAVGLAWVGVIGMAALKIGVHLAGVPWPQLGGFDATYLMILAEFTLTAAALSVLAIRHDWFERVPRAASQKLRALLTLVIAWLTVHLLGAFHLLGGLHGPLLPLLPMLVATAFMALPRSGAWAVATLLVAGHGVVVLLEYNGWIQTPGLLAPLFHVDGAPGQLVLALALGAAAGLGVLVRRQLDHAGANLHRGSRVNPLTGLYEQEFLMERLTTEMERQRRQGGTLTLLMVEFDGFPAYTTAYGYEAGREVLRHAAGVLIRHTRHDMDTPARYAPTTFALLLPDARKDKAADIAERLRAAMADVSQGALHPRAGMACVVDAHGLSPGAVVVAAGKALKQAQADGVPVQLDVPLKPAG
jgi:diguanylate cyclase (GGDEF)-like protein